jgi:hypothetical protein
MWGFDFVVDPLTREAYLIEVNPRATPICHLALRDHRSLPAALYAQLENHPPIELPAPIDEPTIAMFPGEWRRNRASPFLTSAYHDVPWDEQRLVLDSLERPWAERGIAARLWARRRRGSVAAAGTAPVEQLVAIPRTRVGPHAPADADAGTLATIEAGTPCQTDRAAT